MWIESLLKGEAENIHHCEEDKLFGVLSLYSKENKEV